MRSRYTGYATQALDHIVNTTHPESPHYEADRGAWLQDLKDFCTATHFRALEIHSTRTEGTTGWVRFTAHLEQENRAIPMQEHSEFHCVDARWLYLKGIAPSP